MSFDISEAAVSARSGALADEDDGVERPEGGHVAGLIERIRTRQWVVGIVGLGYVGLPLMRAVTNAGFRVLGFDIDQGRVAGLNAGRSPIRHLGDEFIRAKVSSGRFEATADFARAGEADAILICVPTPLGLHREPDLSFVENTVRHLAPYLRRDHLLILESTTWPGTTREVVRPIAETSGLVSGRDIFLAYSPEREDPGNADFDTAAIPKVIGGDGNAALALATALYDEFVARTVPVGSTDVAEAVKLTENIFRAVNIALANELKTVFTTMGIDVFAVIEAAKTKPFGYMPFWPGPGLGGHCIPIDPFYLTWKAREYGVATRFVELAGEINTQMPQYVISCLAEAMDRRGRTLCGSRGLVIGVAYKPDVDDVRESPAFDIIETLLARGATVDYHDPFVPRLPPMRRHKLEMASVALSADELRRHDFAVIVTNHSGIRWDFVVEHSALVVDTRNATAGVEHGRERIVKA